MQFSVALTAGFAAVAYGAVTERLAPKGAVPAGCDSSYPNTFYISTVNASSSASRMVKRQSPNLSIRLQNGVLRDQDGNKGYIAANKQFQFADGADAPEAQDGSIYTAGFSICGNNSLALGPTTIFQSCNSGNFDNLYYGYDAPQCDDVYINAIDTGDSSGSSSEDDSSSASAPSPSAASSAPAAGGAPDNQITAGTAAPTPVTPTASLVPSNTAAPTSYTGAAAQATAAPMAMAAAGALLALL